MSSLKMTFTWQVEANSSKGESLLANMQERLVQTEHGTIVLSTVQPGTQNTGSCYLFLRTGLMVCPVKKCYTEFDPE